MKSCLVLNCFKLHHIIHDTNASMHQQVSCTRKKMTSLRSRLIACCKLASTLAGQMWRHNYVIDRKEYLIFTLSESVNPWVYSLQFLFKSTNNSWRYERKYEWVFFFWTQCIKQKQQYNFPTPVVKLIRLSNKLKQATTKLNNDRGKGTSFKTWLFNQVVNYIPYASQDLILCYEDYSQ